MGGEKEPDYPLPKVRQLGEAVKKRLSKGNAGETNLKKKKKKTNKSIIASPGLYIMALDGCPSYPASHLTRKETPALQIRRWSPAG